MNLTSCPRCCEATFDLHLTRSGFCNGCHSDYLTNSIERLHSAGMLTDEQRTRWLGLIADDGKVMDHTADARPIKPGAVFWDYDLNPTTVLSISHIEGDHRTPRGATIWWKTTTGLFDGSRMAARHPSTQAFATVAS